MNRLISHIRRPEILLGLFVLVISYFTYVHNYQNPDALFWDENYHIASAQKYMNGTFFMEPHPPLGKLLIAFGEIIFEPNAETDQFITTDYGTDIPDDFSFVGYRFFPTVLAWLVAPMLFGIFLLLTRNSLFSMLLSFLYIFDNANIVHSRGAMLESTLLFFAVAMILLFLLLLKEENRKRWRLFAILFGLAFGAVITTKANGLIMILLIPALLWKIWPDTRKISEFLILGTVAFALVFIGVWQTHFSLGSTVIHSLPDEGYYQASEEYKQILADGTNGSIVNFGVMLRDSFEFLPHYARGVPKLDLCKEEENGSPFFMWPFGARTINYRWETPGSGAGYRYLYLVANPVGWLLGLIGVIVSASLLITSRVYPLKEKLQYEYPMAVFLGIYVAYMVAISQLDRVMYLYHYFIPLILSFILFGLVIMEIRNIWKIKLTLKARTIVIFICAAFVFLGYEVYRPLTYYELISDEAFQRRDIIRLWDMRCVKCEKDSVLVRKSC